MTKLEMNKFENIANHITNLDKAVRAFIVWDEAKPSRYDGVDRKVSLHWSLTPDLLKYMARYKGLELSAEQITNYTSLLEKKIVDNMYSVNKVEKDVFRNVEDLVVELSNLHVEYVLDNIE